MKKKKEPMLLGSAVLIRCEKYVVPSVSNSFFFFERWKQYLCSCLKGLALS